MTTSTSSPVGWKVHDYLIGILGGGGLGAVLGVYAAARLVDSDLAIGVGAVVGALVGILLMMQTRQNHRGFWTVTVVVMWILAIGSGLFLYFLYYAIRNLS